METGAIVPFQSRFHAKFSELQIKLVKQLPQFFNAPQTVAPLLPSFSSTSQANRTSFSYLAMMAKFMVEKCRSCLEPPPALSVLSFGRLLIMFSSAMS